MIITDLVQEQDVWVWCSDAYIRNGIRLKLPKCADHTKTYQWRYIKSMTHKFNEWGFNTDTCKKFIDIAVDYAKDLKVLEKGLSVLHQKNMLNICYDKLQRSSGVEDNVTCRLELSKKNINAVNGDIMTFLLKRNDSMSFRNITNWYMSQMICKEYLAISKSAIRTLQAISSIDKDERAFMPSDAALYLLRIRIMDTYKDSSIVNDILKDGQ